MQSEPNTFIKSVITGNGCGFLVGISVNTYRNTAPKYPPKPTNIKSSKKSPLNHHTVQHLLRFFRDKVHLKY